MKLQKRFQSKFHPSLKQKLRPPPRYAARYAAVAGWILLCSSSTSAAVGSKWSGLTSWDKSEAPLSQRTLKSHDTVYNESSPYSPGTHNLALDVGQVFLMGDLTRFPDTIGSQIHYTYGVSDIFGFDTSLGYSEHALGKYSMTSFLAGMRMNLSWYDRIIPYAVLGLGFYRPSYENPSGGGSATSPGDLSSVSAMLFGIHLGPGIDLELSRSLFFGAALTLHQMFGAVTTYSNGTPFFAGGTYTSFLLHADISF
jgi:hypothetical protein